MALPDGSVARRFLAKAFGRAQSAQSRGDSEQITLLLNRSQCPEFFAMRSLDDARQFRAELGAAERSGAIRIIPAKRRVAPNDVKAVIVTDIDALAERLGFDVRSTQVAQAHGQLSPYLDAFPVLEKVLARWKAGRAVRGTIPSPRAVHALLDAIRVRLEREGKTDEVLLRRESIRMFNDSKRIEKLSRWLDLLAEGSLVASGLSRNEIFSALGLHKEPQPFLIAAEAIVTNGDIESRLFRPYHGLPTADVERFQFDPDPECVVTVENKATFHEMALLAKGTRACVIYSGGMPSSAWKKAYAKVLESVHNNVPIYHFGDLDVGGFRIAHAIFDVAGEYGRTLKPWLMDPANLVGAGYTLYPAKDSQIKRMQALCERIGWHALVDSIALVPGLLEQERVTTRLPVGDA